jgi:hypothetical protein
MENKENIKLKFNEMKKENNFKVPDGYFDEFPLRMQERIDQEKKRSWNFSFSLQRSKVTLAYAFASLILVITSIWFLNNINETQNPYLFSNEEIAQIIDTEIMAYDEAMIIDAFINSGADFSTLDMEGEEYDISIDDIDLENILNEL